ncbi:hypothetical protein RB195_019174 [Necator americanus]|uniref:Uncharacterized protein n=1 Tax=Necator americanus TaxID=51031 RepID=A0ABR1CCY2_NECAM
MQTTHHTNDRVLIFTLINKVFAEEILRGVEENACIRTQLANLHCSYSHQKFRIVQQFTRCNNGFGTRVDQYEELRRPARHQ